ncbi:XRE family transcriptional regulator [Avibacterium paragallinarum]|uniref:Helix-turn-helix domain-containing protein n=1 Tax=Avibacterium paragallinarum TaxID=728 RepID=A0ABU7QLK5_AVIPA|nr:S24 family peptidase [Avibacterium paragallinarum]QZP14732.1 helix-turn-helix domain-containing protein [Avibacterium paragallinarum]WAL56639.1 helix-turn-helix domain-containing protein [Avibacterium paragallinarum]WAM59169.1 helix-turn-helix domain-containing protein [Avibacterium paragallinarum]
MESLGQRLKTARKEAGLTQTQLAELIGVSQNAIQKIEAGGDTKHTFALASALGINPIWLQTGNGIMIGSDSKISASQITNNVTYTEVHSDEKLPLAQYIKDKDHRYRIDYLDVRAAAGMTGFINSDYPEIINQIYLSEDGLRELVGRKNTNGICLINVPTDSMEPTIKKGDVVLIDMNINHYNGEGIYAFAIDGELFIKRLQKMISGGFKVISDNKEKYEPEEMNDEIYRNAQFVGKFIRRWRIDVKDL